MYPVKLLAKHLELSAIGIYGTSIFIGRFDDKIPNRILLTNEAGGSSPVVLNGRSIFENDIVTIRVMGNDNYSESLDYVNAIYNWFRNNKRVNEIFIINQTANQPTLIERVDDNLYKFAFTVEITYNQEKLNASA